MTKMDLDPKYLYLPEQFWKKHDQCMFLIKYIEEYVINMRERIEIDIEEGDDEAAAAAALRAMARNQVMLELARTNGKLAAQVEGVFAGLPASVTKEIE